MTTLMPAVFIGHGNPMNTLEHNRYTQMWHDVGVAIGKPRAIVAVSAHWYINATAVTAMTRPKTIHDFYGFPDELFAVQYPAPGAPDVAHEIAEVVKPTWVGMDADSWGIDHGTWSVLHHMYPDADVPVVQLSIDATKDLDYHVGLGEALAPLRAQGILFVCSGNVVHNLRSVDWGKPDDGFVWAHDFDEAVRDVMSTSPGNIGSVLSRESYRNAVPTPDHFIPLLYLCGLARAAGATAKMLIGGYAYGSLSMTSYQLS